MIIQQILQQLVDKHDLTHQQMTAVMQDIMTGAVTDAQIAGFLIALRMKGETVTELTAAVEVMRALATPVHLDLPHIVDIVGTGGDQSNTFNISTATAFVVAAAGAHVAKHGARSVSSQSGSADVLEAAGVNLTLTPAQVAQCVQQIGIGFMFAPQHHSAFKHVVAARRDLKVRTLFNLLGPLTNPAKAKHQLIGVYDKKWLRPVAEAMQQLGGEHLLVVHSDDGMDEISIAAATTIVELKNRTISEYSIDPRDFNLKYSSIDDLKISSAEQSLTLIQQALANKAGAARDIVALNAAAAIYVAGLVDTIPQGFERACQVIADGSAQQKMQDLITLTRQLVNE